MRYNSNSLSKIYLTYYPRKLQLSYVIQVLLIRKLLFTLQLHMPAYSFRLLRIFPIVKLLFTDLNWLIDVFFGALDDAE